MNSSVSHQNQEQIAAHHEKNTAALSSVLAAVFLTAMKLVIGLVTGSLGILSEALHSTQALTWSRQE